MADGFCLEAKKISKSFSTVQVLNSVDFSVKQGEVHALMGENGAGKSTLIKILTGVYTKDAGDIYVDGKIVEINSRQDSLNCGISVIYQELSVIDSLTVEQNICLCNEKVKAGVLIDFKEMRTRVGALIEKYGFHLKPDALLQELSIAQKQMVEILKAISYDSNIIIMDEPTSSLTTKESEMLFEIIERLKKAGKSIIYISHRLDEVYRISDRMTVLRNGELACVLNKEEIDPHHVITAMLGKAMVDEDKVVHQPIENGNVLEVKNLSIGGKLHNISFSAYGGQIFGIGGLVGSGRTELLESIFGLMKTDSGTILLNGKPILGNTRKRIRQGLGLVPEDRHAEGIVGNLSISKNAVLASLDQNSYGNFIMKNQSAKKEALRCMEDVDIRPKIPGLLTKNLSGGNQQKVVIGKWLLRKDLKVLLVDEPTVGVDVGAKSQIYSYLDMLASKGVVIVVVSSDLEELLKISDTIIVMYQGRIFKRFENMQITQHDLIAASSGLE